MPTYHLAADLGASGGKLFLGSLENGKLTLEEVYRFENNVVRRNGHLCWDYDRLLSEILNGMRRCKEIGKIPATVGIDTWGVDYVLLDENDRIIGETYAYRDSRTVGMPEELFKTVPAEEVYRRTGCQPQALNTLFQLYETALHRPEELKRAHRYLMFPEYLNFRLTGKKVNEYTNATTTNFISAATGTWDYELLERVGIPTSAFRDPEQPCKVLGELTEEIAEKVGYSCRVILTPTHDTACAVLAVPTEKQSDYLYISSGTWSIFGTELKAPDTTDASFAAGFTNEGGCGGSIRYLRNLNGMWLIQSVRRELGEKQTYDELADLARAHADFPSFIDVADARFLAPDSMIEEVKAACRDSGQKVPSDIGEVLQCIYAGLARNYAKYTQMARDILGIRPDRIHIVGGGSKDAYLNELTAKTCGLPVYAGPKECSALGNLLSQLMAEGELDGIAQARKCVADSFECKKINA